MLVGSKQGSELIIATSYVAATNQTRGFCAGGIVCTSDDDCNAGLAKRGTNNSEILTGRCSLNNATGFGHCEKTGWCQVGDLYNEDSRVMLSDTGNFTVSFRVDGTFSLYDNAYSSGSDFSLWNYTKWVAEERQKKIFAEMLGEDVLLGDDLEISDNMFFLSDIVGLASVTTNKDKVKAQNGCDVLLNPKGCELIQESDVDNTTGSLVSSYFDSVIVEGASILVQARLSHPLSTSKPCNIDSDTTHCQLTFEFSRIDDGKFHYRFASPLSIGVHHGESRTLYKVFDRIDDTLFATGKGVL